MRSSVGAAEGRCLRNRGYFDPCILFLRPECLIDRAFQFYGAGKEDVVLEMDVLVQVLLELP